MKRLTNEEIRELESKKLVICYSNFEQNLNGTTEEEAQKSFLGKPFDVIFIDYIDNSDNAIYSLGNNYYMTAHKQKYHKAVNKLLVSEGIEQPLPEFDEVISIYKVVE